MASLGKKILSAFVEVAENQQAVIRPAEQQQHFTQPTAAKQLAPGAAEKFTQYFDKLFSEANLPGPDYYEFAKMTQAMAVIPDEKARYGAAFAGLNVQGLDKQKLLDTAHQYLKIMETDAVNFNSTVDAALVEKVEAKQKNIRDKQQRIEQLNREINDLQTEIQLLQIEVKENEEKIESNTGGYNLSSEKMTQQILSDIEKIKQYIA